jgi:hypothetical protein
MATLQKTIVGDNTSYADFQGWAGDITAAAGTGTGIAAALYALGFTKTSDQYNAVWTGGTLPTVGSNLIGATCFPAMSANARVALAGTMFNLGTAGASAWLSGQTYTAGQVATYGGFVWICNLSNSTSNTTTPAADTTKWSQYFMEIWSAVSSGLTTFYIKLEYGCSSNVGKPMFTIQFGTGYVTNSGVLSGNVSLTEQCMVDNAVATSTECDWSGDGQNWFGMMMWRGSTTQANFVCFERGISGQSAGAPVYSSANQYITWLVGSGAGTPFWHQCSLFLGAVGTTNSVRNAWVSNVEIFTAGSQIVNNITPALPIFPLVGWCGNPLSCAQTYSLTDTTEGATVSSVVYGTAKNYLTTINAFVQKLGGTNATDGISIKWQ